MLRILKEIAICAGLATVFAFAPGTFVITCVAVCYFARRESMQNARYQADMKWLLNVRGWGIKCVNTLEPAIAAVRRTGEEVLYCQKTVIAYRIEEGPNAPSALDILDRECELAEARVLFAKNWERAQSHIKILKRALRTLAQKLAWIAEHHRDRLGVTGTDLMSQLNTLCRQLNALVEQLEQSCDRMDKLHDDADVLLRMIRGLPIQVPARRNWR
jgi:hypothetical protein